MSPFLTILILILSFETFTVTCTTKYNVTFSLSGGHTFCDECDDGSVSVDHYEMLSPGYYVLKFTNPLPEGYQLKSVNIYILGIFECGEAQQPTSITLSLCSFVIVDNYNLTNVNTNCSCPNCHSYATINGPTESTWNGYSYSQNDTNDFTMEFFNNEVSISTIFLELVAADINPIVDIYSQTVSMGDSVTLTGIFYWIQLTYICEYTNPPWKVQAQYSVIEPEVAICELPELDQPQYLDLYFYPDTTEYPTLKINSSYIGPYLVFINGPPVLVQITPNQSVVYGGIEAVIEGKGFFESQVYVAVFQNEYVNTTFINESAISCIVPKAQSPTMLDIQVFQNNQLWTNSIMFTYVPDNSQPLIAMIAIVSTVIALCVFLVFLFFACNKNNATEEKDKPMYEEIPNFDPSLIIPYTELTFKELIGRGSFGSVFKCKWRHGDVAVKKVHDPTEKFIKDLLEEANFMVPLRHPNIVIFMGCTLTPHVCLITEYVSRGSLYNILHNKNMDLELVHIQRFLIDTCKGMAYLHAENIIHRDLKCHNLLVSHSWTVKVADFGLSRVTEAANKNMTACGTPQWAAPEVLRNEKYSHKADVFSFGVCLWEMLTRKDPYGSLPPYHVVVSVATKGMRPPLTADLEDNPLVDIMKECWNESPDNRPEFGELIKSFNSFVFHSHDFPADE